MKTTQVSISIRNGKIETIVSNTPVNFFMVNHDIAEDKTQTGHALVIKNKRYKTVY